METVERNNRFYTKETREMLTENEQLKEWLVIANKENERLHSIIKEVREYCTKYENWEDECVKDILEILDKENKDD